MIDLNRNPTARECNELLKRGRREAKAGRGPMSGLKLPFATELARSYEAACTDVCVRLECSVASSSARYGGALAEIGAAKKALGGGQARPALPPVDGGMDDYQEAYRAERRREVLAKDEARHSAEAQSATAQARLDRAAAIGEIKRIKQCAVSWLQPYAEGVFDVDPLLVEQLRPFETPSMFSGDVLADIEKVAVRYRAVFGDDAKPPAIGGEARGALEEGALAFGMAQATTTDKETIRHA